MWDFAANLQGASGIFAGGNQATPVRSVYAYAYRVRGDHVIPYWNPSREEREMPRRTWWLHRRRRLQVLAVAVVLALGIGGLGSAASAQDIGGGAAPMPLVAPDQPVAWGFVCKFNEAVFPGCGPDAVRTCPFGGDVQDYHGRFSQPFVAASSAQPSLTKGAGCLETTATDPVGVTFRQVYEGAYFYMLWNDQFYNDPPIAGCDQACGAPWEHAKGMVAWNAAGEGVARPVSTPPWPASGSHEHPRRLAPPEP